MMDKVLVLLTAQYPYGKSETFLENEIQYLSPAFEKIYIIAQKKADSIREVPPNVMVLNLQDEFKAKYSSGRSLRTCNLLSIQFFAQELKSKRSYTSIQQLISYFLRINYKAILLENLLYSHKINLDSVFYSYWFEEWATILAMLKRKGIIHNFIARAHRFDLYEEKNTLGFIPFRELQLKEVNKVFSISRDGFDYLASKYPLYKNKYTLSYLGVHDRGISPAQKEEKPFLLVSCSNIVSVKRVHLIAEALQEVGFPLKWVHFGDGPLLQQIKTLVSRLPDHIQVELKGRVPNTEVLDFYSKNSVNLFINVSASEGLPVSIMEAISFGIPVLATDVGGTAEIVKQETGILIKENLIATAIAAQIAIFNASPMNSSKSREGVRRFWEDHFDASVNYPKFIADLKMQAKLKC